VLPGAPIAATTYIVYKSRTRTLHLQSGHLSAIYRLFLLQAAAPDLVTPALTHAARHVLSPADAPTSLRHNNELLLAAMAGALGRAALAAPVRRRIFSRMPELIAE